LIANLFCLATTWVTGIKLFYFMFPWQSLWKASLASFVMAIILKVIFSEISAGILSLISKIMVGAFVYLIRLIILKEETSLSVLKSGKISLKAILSVFSERTIDGGE
jgi:hypothetical protein